MLKPAAFNVNAPHLRSHAPRTGATPPSVLIDTAQQIANAIIVAFVLLSLGGLFASLSRRFCAGLPALEARGASGTLYYLFWAALCGLAAFVWADFARVPWRPRRALPSWTDVLVVVGVVLALLLSYQAALFRLLLGSVHAPLSALFFFMGALLGPFVEEWIYRGFAHCVLLAKAPRLGIGGAIVIGSLIFGFSHLFFDHRSDGWLRDALGPTYFGGLMALLRWRLDGLLPGCLAHVLVNSLILLT